MACAVLALGHGRLIQGTTFSSLRFCLISVVAGKAATSIEVALTRPKGVQQHESFVLCRSFYPMRLQSCSERICTACWPWVALMGATPQNWQVCIVQQFLVWLYPVPFDWLPFTTWWAGQWVALNGGQSNSYTNRVQSCLGSPVFFYLVCWLYNCCY